MEVKKNGFNRLLKWVIACAFVSIIALTLDKERTSLPVSIIHTLEVLDFADDGDSEYSPVRRQRVELRLKALGPLETLTISTIENSNKDFTVGDDQWLSVSAEGATISKMSDREMYISYQGKTVFSTEDLGYDYIDFNAICTASDNSQQLLFSMRTGGSATGNIEDMLYFYKDPVTGTFQSKFIERRYLPDKCDMGSASLNEQLEVEQLAEFNAIHKKLRPAAIDTDINDYLALSEPLPTKQFSKAELTIILDELKPYIFIDVEMADEGELRTDYDEDEYFDYYTPEVVIQDIAENDNWLIKEVLYLQLYTSWGVLLAQDKSTGQWTSFYTVSGGDSKQHLYFNDEVELGDNELRGIYSPYGDQRVAISLLNFTVNDTHPYAFSDYPVETGLFRICRKVRY